MNPLSLDDLNKAPLTEARVIFLRCCNCRSWAAEMSEKRPFATLDAMLQQAKVTWQNAQERDILEAFSGHAKIGDLSETKDAGVSAATQKEQGQVANAKPSTLEKLSHLNQLYFEKFGFIYIVFATGKSATEMLELLQVRITNTRQQELANGAIEQGKITDLRLKQLFEHRTA